MLYMQTADGLKLVILETANLEEIKNGRPAVTLDNSVLIAWTPDPVWLADKIMETGGDAESIARLIDECSKRPQKQPRPCHEKHEHSFTQEKS